MTKTRLYTQLTVSVVIVAVLACFHPNSAAKAPCDHQVNFIFEDKFDQKELKAGWSWLREHSEYWRFLDGALEIRVEPGLKDTCRNVLLRDVPDRSRSSYAYEVTVTNLTEPTQLYEQAGITWYSEGKPVMKLVKELVDGQLMIIPGRKPMAEESVRLQLVVTADSWTALYQPGASGPFFETGSGKLPAPSNDQVSLVCYNGSSEAEHWIRFQDFRISQLANKAENAATVNQKCDKSTKAKQKRHGDFPFLNYHLMHPGDPSAPGDPNPTFFLDGTYHLHYILQHPWKGGRSYSFVHVTSPDMLHWTWHKTKLQPSFTGHGMYSGQGFITKEGKPAMIYHGQASERNHIAIAKDNCLSAWEKPYVIKVRTEDGQEVDMNHWDPGCFLVGDTYYAISGGKNPPVFRSKDLRSWTYIGEFLKHDMPDVAVGEDISCPNFFRLGDKWMMLCISHTHGCRYYLGEWDSQAEQFVPESHGRMNWRRDYQYLEHENYRDFFAPESVLTPDGRRVMWAWCALRNRELHQKTIQSLPRELSLGEDGSLRIQPLSELALLRYEPVVFEDITVIATHRLAGGLKRETVQTLSGDAYEVRVTVERQEAERKRFGVQLFANDDRRQGLLITVSPATATLRVGKTEAPFAVAELPRGEDLELRIFIDKYFVEVFANERQALLASYLDWQKASDLKLYSFGGTTTFKKVEIWKLKPTNQGFLEALESRIYESEVE